MQSHHVFIFFFNIFYKVVAILKIYYNLKFYIYTIVIQSRDQSNNNLKVLTNNHQKKYINLHFLDYTYFFLIININISF